MRIRIRRVKAKLASAAAASALVVPLSCVLLADDHDESGALTRATLTLHSGRRLAVEAPEVVLAPAAAPHGEPARPVPTVAPRGRVAQRPPTSIGGATEAVALAQPAGERRAATGEPLSRGEPAGPRPIARPEAKAPGELLVRNAHEPETPGLTPKTRSEPVRLVPTDAGATLTATRHEASFDERGFTFVPRDAAGAALDHAKVVFSLASVRRGEASLYERDRDGQGRFTTRTNEVVFQRTPGLVERYRVGMQAAVEQTFTLAQLPAGTGDLVVETSIESALRPSLTDDGEVAFRSGAEEIVSYGRALAIDGLGRTVDAPLACAADRLEIRVPGDWLARAQGPIVIDPLVGSNLQITAFTNHDQYVDLAWNEAADEWLAVYVNNGNQLAVSRLDDTGAVIAGGVVLDSSTDAKDKPALCYSDPTAGRFLCAYTRAGDVWVTVIDGGLNVISSPARIFDPTGAEDQRDPHVAYDPSRSRWLVTWTDDSQSASRDLLAETVLTNGTQQGTVLIQNSTPAFESPSVSYSVTSDRYLIVFDSGTDLWGDVVDGAVSSILAAITVSSLTGTQEKSELAWNDADDEWLCVFESDDLGDDDILGRRVDQDGTLLGSLLTIGASGTLVQQDPDVAFGAGTYLVGYDEESSDGDWDVWAREVNDDGTFTTSSFQVSASAQATSNEVLTAVAWSATSAQWLQLWQDGRDLIDFDIWGQRITSASVDTTAPDPPVIATPADNSEVEDSTPLVEGTAEPLSTVEVLVGGASTSPATTTQADASGDWSVELAQALTNGSYTLTATATDASSNTSAPSTAVNVTVVVFTVSFSGTDSNFLLEPDRGATRTTTVTISDTSQSVTVKSTNPAKFKLLSSGVEVDQIAGVTNGQVVELIGLEQGPGPSGSLTLRAETAGGTVKADRDVLTRARAFAIEAQCPTRNGACTATGGLADPQDGASLDLGRGIFAWSHEVLPGVQGRNGLAPDWTIRMNSRAHSRGGNFGRSPFDLFCFMRVRESGGDVVWQEPRVREHLFDAAATGGKTARARYEVVSDSPTEVVLRGPDGTRLRFHPLDGSFKEGLLTRVETRFGDRIDVTLDARGFATEVYDALGREWTLAYDAMGRLSSITEDATTLLGRTCSFTYDSESRLTRIDTTPVTIDGGIGNTFSSGKPVVLTYESTLTGDLRLDTNVETIVYPAQVLDASNTPRLQLTYGTSGTSFDRVTAQVWGGTNATGVAAGGTVTLTYSDLALPQPDSALTKTEVTDRNGNQTVYRFNSHALPVTIEELTNRDVRGTTDDPTSFLTTRTFNADEEVTAVVLPLGNEVQYTFDTSNVDRYAHGNLLEERRIADTTRGGDGQGSTIADLVRTWRYEPIFQGVRIATSARGNDAAFTPPIADDEANVEDLDFNLDDDTNDANDGETLRARRYSSVTIYDFQELTASALQTLASAEGVTLTGTQADALSLGNTVTVDQNQDGVTTQQVGRPIEVRAPNVTLEDGSVQLVRTNYHWNAFGQLLAEIDAEGYVDDYSYYPESAPCRPGQSATPNPPGRTLSTNTGGYLEEVVRDSRTLIRTPAVSASRVEATTTSQYNNAGVRTKLIDPRGVVHTSTVNERNQVQVSIRAESTSSLSSEEPRALAALHYETRTHYDANDNVKKVEVENLVPPDPGSGATAAPQSVTGNAWLETTLTYDLLDDLIEQTQEVSNGETRRLRGRDLAVGSAESITTRFRYSRNQEQVLVISPEAVAGTTGEANNVTSAIFDERGLPWKSTQGGVDPQWSTLAANQDITLPTGVTTTARTATTRTRVDANGNTRFTIDADDDGSPHDGTGGLMETDDSTVAGTQRGDPTETRYDGFDRTVTVIDAMGYQSAMGCACSGSFVAYDPDGNVLKRRSVGPGGGNLRGGGVDDRILSETRDLHDELSRVYRHEQDFFRTPQSISSPTVEAVYVSKTLFDRSSRAVRQTRPLGDHVETDHDGLDRPIVRRTSSLTGAAGTFVPSEVTTVYDDAGNVVQVKEVERSVETGAAETFYMDTFFDAVNRPELVVSNHFAGNTANATRTEYDSRGQVVARIDANGSGTTTQSVNRGGSLTLTINSTGNAVVFVHDGLGRDVRTERELRVGHDGSNAIDTSNPTNSDGFVTTLRDWDKNSRLVSETDDEDTSVASGSTNPSTTTYSYDDLNRRVGQTNADSQARATTFDKDGHASTFTDENGSVFTRTFDDLGRTTQVSISRATGVEGTTLQTFEYDGLSRVTEKTNDNGSQDDSVVVCTFDSLSRELEESQQIGALSARLVTSEFDANSNLIQVTYSGVIGSSGRRKVTYGYRDSTGKTLNRVELIEEGAGTGTGDAIVPTGSASARIARYGYAGPVRIATRTYGDGSTGNGPVLSVSYDALRRATQYSHAVFGPDFTFEYAFDRVGNRLMENFVHEGVRDQYQYDSVGRLTFEGRSADPGTASTITNNQVANPAQEGADTRTWDRIDGANNWTRVVGSGVPSRTMTANEVNEYTAVDSVSRSHDDNGNLVNDGTKSYFFDAFNRLVRVRRNSDGLDIAFYAYDAEGRRIRRHVQNSGSLNTTVTYFYLGGSVVEEGDASGVPQRQYVWGERLLQYKVGSATVYCHENGYGSIARTTLEASETFDERDYNAYGEFVQGGIDTGLSYAFAGVRFDPETGLYGSRYDPALGRTISRSPKSDSADGAYSERPPLTSRRRLQNKRAKDFFEKESDWDAKVPVGKAKEPCVVTDPYAKAVPGVFACFGYEAGSYAFDFDNNTTGVPNIFRAAWGAGHGYVEFDGVGYGLYPGNMADVKTWFGAPGVLTPRDASIYPRDHARSQFSGCMRACLLRTAAGSGDYGECARRCRSTASPFRLYSQGTKFAVCMPVLVSNCCDVEKFRQAAWAHISAATAAAGTYNLFNPFGITPGRNCLDFIDETMRAGFQGCGDAPNRSYALPSAQ